MRNIVTIHKHVLFEGKPHEDAYFTAKCRRCNRNVVGKDRQGNSSWATKPSAVRQAKAHMEWHADEDHFDGVYVDKGIVGIVMPDGRAVNP